MGPFLSSFFSFFSSSEEFHLTSSLGEFIGAPAADSATNDPLRNRRVYLAKDADDWHWLEMQTIPNFASL